MQKQDDLNYVLHELKGDMLENNFLSKRHETFKKKYEELITYLFSNNKPDDKLE